MARFGLLYLDEGLWLGERVIPAEWISRSLQSASIVFEDGTGYGYLWWHTKIDGHDAFHAHGAGTQSIYLVPSYDLVYVFRDNTYDFEPIADAEEQKLLALILDAKTGEAVPDPVLINARWPERLPDARPAHPDALRERFGEYANDRTGPITLTEEDGQVLLILERGRFRLIQAGDRFLLEDMEIPLLFVEDGQKRGQADYTPGEDFRLTQNSRLVEKRARGRLPNAVDQTEIIERLCRPTVSFLLLIVYNCRVTGLLLQTKLFKPTLRPSLIPRPHLIAQLNASLGKGAQGFSARMTLVSAPAGFGKTTLVAAWLAQLTTFDPSLSSKNTVWLSLDENDNDPVHFLAYLIAAIQRAVPGIGEAAGRILQSAQPPAAETVLTSLINDLVLNGRPIILALDDYHVITTPAVHRALAFLLDRLPPQLHLLISTRSDPPLPLSRLRARGQMSEIRTNDLRFTFDEVRVFLSEVMGLALSDDEVAAVEERTEGWIAGLQLAALSMQGREDIPGLVAAFTGSNRFILDYLLDEVLAYRPKGTRSFLLQTSILGRLCGPLCDAVTGQCESQAILERLEQANLFLVPLDHERRWYRYHHLFAEVLHQRLLQEQPKRAPELHRRAQDWLQKNGLIPEAVNHALAGRDFEQAAALIERVAGSMLRKGSSTSLTMWLEAIPLEIVLSHPRLCLARGWSYIMGQSLSLANADEWARRALQAAASDRSTAAELAGEAAALQAMIAAIWDKEERSIELLRRALASLPADSPWRSVMAFCLGSTLFLAGNMAEAPQALEEALMLSKVEDAHYIQLNAASFLADIQVFQGKLSRATEMYRQVLAWADHGIPQKGALMAHGGLAHIFCERNQLDAALSHVRQGIEQLESVGGAWAALVIYRALARVQWARGDWQGALDSLERAYNSGRRTKVNIVVAQAAALRARLHVARGDLQAAAAWAANSGLSPDDPAASHPGLREEEYLSLARVLGAQRSYAGALSLLERLLCAAEAEDRMGSAIAILIHQGLIHQAQDNTVRALACLERALNLAEPEGYCRIFLEEGQPMAALLRRARQHTPTTGYVDSLQFAFAAARSAPQAAASSPEILSERELEVLRLIATGASNQEIAGELYIAVSTVKKHVGHILVKLDTANRMQAAARARALGLLS